MKKCVGLSVVLLLAGCEMSDADKQQLARSTCNVISNTAGDDSTARLKELNSAREQLGESLYTDSDDDIRYSVKFGICESLVLNDPAYESLISQNKEMVDGEKKRIHNVAAIACAVMKETRQMDAAIRVKELNAARLEIGEEPFLDGDDVIKEAIENGLCVSLVKNPRTYPAMLRDKKVARAAARERAREEAREETRQEREMSRQRWRAAMESELQEVSLELRKASYDDQRVRLSVEYTCKPIKGFSRKLIVVLKNNLGFLVSSTDEGSCLLTDTHSDEFDSSKIKFDMELALYGTEDPTKFIEEIYVLIDGVHNPSPEDKMHRLDPKTYPLLDEYSKLLKPIRINVKM